MWEMKLVYAINRTVEDFNIFLEESPEFAIRLRKRGKLLNYLKMKLVNCID